MPTSLRTTHRFCAPSALPHLSTPKRAAFLPQAAPSSVGHHALTRKNAVVPATLCLATPATRDIAPAKLPPDKIWRLGVQDVQQEFITPVPVKTHGRIPAELDLSLFRNGPGRFTGERHWFDGQGFLVKLGIHNGQVTYQSRFIETAEQLVEQRAAKRRGHTGTERLYGRYGAPLPHGLWTILRGRLYKNVANTSILHHAQRLFALGEGGAPERIDPHTLASLGTDRMNALGPADTFSAHPKRDPKTGVVWNFGISYEFTVTGMQARLRLYRCDPNGTVKTHYDTVLPFAGAMHDFCLTDTKAVLVLAPSTFPKMPLDWILGKNSLGRIMQWRPELGSRVVVVDLKTGATRWHRTDPMVVQHTVNAWDEGDDVVFDVCDADDPKRWLMWYDVMAGDVHPRRLPRLRRFRVSPDSGVAAVYHTVAEMEFPTVDPRYVAKAHRKVFGVKWDEREPFFGTPYVVDVKTGHMRYATLQPGEYAGEPLLVNKRGGNHPEGDVWILTVVMCTQEATRGGETLPAGRSELQIFDAKRMERGPIACSVLPQVVPYGFHGAAVPNHLLESLQTA